MQTTRRKRLSDRRRGELVRRDAYRCQICKAPFLQVEPGRFLFDLDHAAALCNRGTNDEDLLRSLCRSCHYLKTHFDVQPRKWEVATGLSKFFIGPLATSRSNLFAYYLALNKLRLRLLEEVIAFLPPLETKQQHQQENNTNNNPSRSDSC